MDLAKRLNQILDPSRCFSLLKSQIHGKLQGAKHNGAETQQWKIRTVVKDTLPQSNPARLAKARSNGSREAVVMAC